MNGQPATAYSMPEARCPNCNKLLLKGWFDRVEIQCPRCPALIRLYQHIGRVGPAVIKAEVVRFKTKDPYK